MPFRYPARHPGPFRFIQADSEVAGILVAPGFVVMAVVGIPLARWFVLGAATHQEIDFDLDSNSGRRSLE